MVAKSLFFDIIGSPHFIADHNILNVHYLHHVYKSTEVKRSANN